MYIAEETIKSAVDRLSHSNAHKRLAEFLIIKRAMSLNQEESVTLSLGNEILRQSISDILGTNSNTDKPLINIFGTGSHNDLGYRSERYFSNGIADTVSAGNWLNSITQIISNSPRTIRFKDDYLKSLASFFHKSSGKNPRLIDTAIWYYRSSNINSIADSYQKREHDLHFILTKSFLKELGITESEVKLLFENETLEDSISTTSSLTDPLKYLPGENKGEKPDVTNDVRSDKVSLDLVLSLAVKGFVILTGPSGTGKSREGLHLAVAIKNELAEEGAYHLEAVQPNWSDSSFLIGYRSPFGSLRESLKNGGNTNETYEITDTLKLLIRAADPTKLEIPFILILDEMNLSHVEHYLAPLLSIIEANSSLPIEEKNPAD